MDKTIIKVDYAMRKKIMSIHQCTYPTVRSALNGTNHTKLAMRIRKTAMECGGVEYRQLEVFTNYPTQKI